MSQQKTLQNQEELAAVNIKETEKEIASKKIEIEGAIKALENTAWYKDKMTDADITIAKHNYEVANQENANNPCWIAESPHLEKTCVDKYMNIVKNKEASRNEYNRKEEYAKALRTELSKLEEKYQEALAEQPIEDVLGDVNEAYQVYIREL